VAWFEHADGRVYYEQAGAGRPLLFLPGLGESIDQFRALWEPLAAKFHVVAADLPGSGKSLPQPRRYSASYYDEDAATFASLLRAGREGAAHLDGFSDGGETELVMAAQYPALVRSVAAWGSAGKIAASLEAVEAFGRLVDAPGELMGEYSNQLEEMYGRANARALVRNAAAAWTAMIADGGDICWARTGAIACPVLLITGGQDPFAPPPVVAELSRRIAGAAFVEVPGAGHDLYAERPGWLQATLDEWLVTQRSENSKP
jgi:valacyclovir hydrolase